MAALNASDFSARLHGQLNRLEQADLIRLATAVPDLEYLFRHALIQESAYQTLMRADRRRVHRAAGEALEALLAGREPPAELAPQLARHFEEAADYPRALHYYTLAGDGALAGYANAEAVAAYSRALAAAERSPADAERTAVAAATWQHLFEARGRALELMSQFSEALTNYRAMASRAEVLGDRRLALAAAVDAGQLYATITPLFDPSRADRMATSALAEARALGDEPAEAKILWNQLNLNRILQRNPQARACGEQSLEIARRLDLKTQAALTVNDLVHVYATLGLWPEFEQASGEARQRWQALGNIAMLADSLSSAAMYKGLSGQITAALDRAREAHQHAVAIGNEWGQAFSLSTMLWPHWYTGHPDRAIEAVSECLRVGQEAWPIIVGTVEAWLAFMHAELGDTDGSLEWMRQAAVANQQLGGINIQTILATRVHLELRATGVAQAAATLHDMEKEKQPPAFFEVDWVLRARSEVALAQGDADSALEVTQAHVARLRELGLLTYLPEALAGLAQALLLQGRVPEAKYKLVEALAHAQAMGAVMVEWTVLYALGRLELEHGDRASAALYWARAREIVTVIAARIPTPGLRQFFLTRPELRALLADSHLFALENNRPMPGQPAP